MLTRAYDTIMAALQVPMLAYTNSPDYDTSSVQDSLLNCKSISGTVRNIFCSSYKNSATSTTYGSYYNSSTVTASNVCEVAPFSKFAQSTSPSVTDNVVFPDEDSSTPSYEDYSSTAVTASGWTAYSPSPATSTKTYDSTTKEFVITITANYQNTSGSSKTVYGIKIIKLHPYRSSATSGTSGTPSTDSFLLCREQFAEPITVPANGIVVLNFTYRVGRGGITGTGASA